MSKKKKKKNSPSNQNQPRNTAARGSARKSASKAKPAQSTFSKWRFGRRYEYTPDGKTILHKRTYVLEDKLKKLLLGSFLIVLITFVLVNVMVIVGNNLKNDAIEKAYQEELANANTSVVALNGLSSKQRDLVDSTGKFDGFAEVGGVEAADVYDSDITVEDARVLDKRKQLDGTGIVDPKLPKNENTGENANKAIESTYG